MSSETSRENRIREVKERASGTREGRGAVWNHLIETDPDMFEAYQSVYERGLLPGKALPVKYRELVAISILAFRGLRESVISHARRAHRYHGLTKEELLDAAKTALIPGGAPTFTTYLAAVQAIEEDEKRGTAE